MPGSQPLTDAVPHATSPESTDVVALTSQLVAIPSVSRDSNCEVADVCTSHLAASGFEVEVIDADDRHGVTKRSLIAHRGDPNHAGFAYLGHTDVVPATDWTGPGSPFEPTLSGGRLYGRGSCDMKGSVAAMLTAAARSSHETLWVVLTSDEESGFNGARAIRDRSRMYPVLRKSGSVAIIGEPTLGRPVHGHKGGAIWKLAATGVQQHSSFGTEAAATLRLLPVLSTLQEIVALLQTDPFYRDGRFEPPGTTPNVRLLDASPALNVTSSAAHAEIFLRTLPGVDLSPLRDRLAAAADAAGIDFETRESSALFRDPESPFLRELQRLTGHPAATVCYGTDGCIFGDLKEIAVCGPGSIEQAHTTDEFITVEELHAGVRLYEKLIERFAAK